MRTPRSGRLGLLGVGAVFALVASALSPVTAVAAGPSTESDVEITKTWSATSLANGGTVVATITLDNTGGAARPGTVLTDVYDPGLTYVAGSATAANTTSAVSCVDNGLVAFGQVTCTNIGVPAGGVTTITLTFTAHYWGYAKYTKNYPTDERLDIQKAETHVDIQSGQSKTARVDCQAGYDLLDYSWHLQHVDQDTGDFSDVYLLTSNVDNTSATVQLFNDAGGKAQGKLWALCLKNKTNLNQSVVWGGQENKTATFAPDGPLERPFYAECDSGLTPMAINLKAAKTGLSDPDVTYQDELITQTGLEADGSRRATVWAIVKDHALVTLQWRCLNVKVGAHRMFFDVKTESKPNIPAQDKVAQQQITCDVGYKGIVGGWRGGHFNGSEPRPKIRNYWLWHDGSGVKRFDGKLLCLKSRLMRGGKLQKNGSISDQLNNHARGTTSGTEYMTPVSPAIPLMVKQG